MIDAGATAAEELLLATADLVPAEARADWVEYVRRIVADVWDRPALGARERSLITVAATAVLRTPTALRTQVRIARVNGLSRRELCEVVFQIGGYAGFAIATEAMVALREVFDEEGDEAGDADGESAGDVSWPPLEGRHDRALDILRLLTGEQAEMIWGLTPAHPVDGGATRPAIAPNGPWMGWVNDTTFGDLWSRPHLSAADRERVVTATLIVLSRVEELEPHLRTNFAMGFSAEEVGEAILQLAPFVGVPVLVESMRLARTVQAQVEEARGTN